MTPSDAFAYLLFGVSCLFLTGLLLGIFWFIRNHRRYRTLRQAARSAQEGESIDFQALPSSTKEQIFSWTLSRSAMEVSRKFSHSHPVLSEMLSTPPGSVSREDWAAYLERIVLLPNHSRDLTQYAVKDVAICLARAAGKRGVSILAVKSTSGNTLGGDLDGLRFYLRVSGTEWPMLHIKPDLFPSFWALVDDEFAHEIEQPGSVLEGDAESTLREFREQLLLKAAS